MTICVVGWESYQALFLTTWYWFSREKTFFALYNEGPCPKTEPLAHTVALALARRQCYSAFR